jgi:hypothetical protein
VLYASILPAPTDVAAWHAAAGLVKVVDADLLPAAVHAVTRHP